MIDWFSRVFPDLSQTFAVAYLLSPLHIATTIVIAWLVWKYSRVGGSFAKYLFPKEIYRHGSSWLDIKLAIFNTFFLATGAIAALVMLPWVTLQVHGYLVMLTGYDAVEDSIARAVFAGVVLFLAQDFCRYVNHFIHHKYKYLWPFHAVHHSAEVMTPITFLRAHPVYYALQVVLMSLLGGVVYGVVLFALVGNITATTVYVGVFIWNAYVFFGAHLRHSHIWLSYGRVLEHVLISPAQHQVHHSSDPKHHDKNFGEVLAIWDWMFGTLYVPRGKEDLTFGIANGKGERLPQPYPTLRDALIGPFEEVWEQVAAGTSFDLNKEATIKTKEAAQK